MNKDILKNYRPAGNSSHLSKVVEKVVATRLSEHLMSQNMADALQFTYKAERSTEIALVKVANDVRLALDKHERSLLVLLDLRSVFDTMDQRMLVRRFRERLGC